ncbi:hypothetical protein ACFSTH_02120 [Paenibacillus yanchengensis]|uniref:Uncharacterized protein n=1 Tax=Paenibacillus yanchengensis TaxID=2035833 RepID=A0ABW4YQJ4_9BACL
MIELNFLIEMYWNKSGDLHDLEQARLMNMIQTELKKSQLIWIEKKTFLLSSLRTVSSNWTLAH